LPPTSYLNSHRARRIAVAVALGGGLAVGVAGLAQAADPAPSGSAAPSGAVPSAEAGRPGPGRGEPREHKPHLDGTVKSISDTKILITDRDGFTRQITIKSKPDGVAVGTRVHAEGTVNPDGVSLDATSVVVAPEGPGKHGGGFGHRGGGPGGPRGGGAAPAPSGSAAPSESAPSAPGGSAPSTPSESTPGAPGGNAPSAPAPSAS
jgi:hypothetical protein